MSTERRAKPRPRVLKGACIWYAGHMSTMDCQVRDLTDDGCRLRTEGAPWAPKEFELSLGQGVVIERCEVVWRKANELGVRFVRAA